MIQLSRSYKLYLQLDLFARFPLFSSFFFFLLTSKDEFIANHVVNGRCRQDA